MARNPVTGHYYVWWHDNIWCEKYGNGVVNRVGGDHIVVTFSWWTGTMDNKTWHSVTKTIWEEHFVGAYNEIGGTGYWRLDALAVS